MTTWATLYTHPDKSMLLGTWQGVYGLPADLEGALGEHLALVVPLARRHPVRPLQPVGPAPVRALPLLRLALLVLEMR